MKAEMLVSAVLCVLMTLSPYALCRPDPGTVPHGSDPDTRPHGSDPDTLPHGSDPDTLPHGPDPDTLPHRSDPGTQQAWLQWKLRHRKVYPHALHEARAHALWLRHWHLVQSHNSRSDVTFTLELNAFADQELGAQRHAGVSHPLRYVPQMAAQPDDIMSVPPPASFDWRQKGVISPVRNQGQLGSADAFAVTDDLESLHAINTGQLVALSVAEVSDCCSAVPGMLVPDIYECIARHGGLCSEAAYPPHPPPPACRNQSCRAVAKDATVTKRVPKGDEGAMVTAVLLRPLVVHLDAGQASFQVYQAGVYSDPQCGHRLDHAMLLVGYGVTSAGQPFWILKNSWGADWGLQGYMWLERGVNMCGVADDVIYPR
ncbi:hypothetical protein ACOMHN_036363 [Nucella lapillus]